MSEGFTTWWDNERDAHFVGMTGDVRFWVGKTDDPTDKTPCWESEVVTDDLDEDKEWFSEDCMRKIAKAASIDLLYGDSHKSAMINPDNEIGAAIEHEIIHSGNRTILKARGEFDVSHPAAQRCWAKAIKNPEKYKISIGGLVRNDWLEHGAVHKSGVRGTEIQDIDTDHYLLCRANAARNQHTSFAAYITKAIGADDEDDDTQTVKAWAGRNDLQVRTAVDQKLREEYGTDDGYGGVWTSELYEGFAIATLPDGQYVRLALTDSGGDLMVGEPAEVKRAYAEKCWIDQHYPVDDAEKAVIARMKAMQRQIGWDVALPEIYKAFQALGLDWDEDALGKAIDPAILAEEKEVLKAADEMAELETPMDKNQDEKLGTLMTLAKMVFSGKADEAETAEPVEQDPVATIAATLKDGFDSINARLDSHDEQFAAWKADEADEEPEVEEPDEEPEEEDEEEAPAEDEPEPDKEAEKADGDDEPSLADVMVALKAVHDDSAALSARVVEIAEGVNGLGSRTEVLEKARGHSNALGEGDPAPSESPSAEPGLNDDPRFYG
jgi:hypothetical protein